MTVLLHVCAWTGLYGAAAVAAVIVARGAKPK
jgi:hypothetical protein